MVDSTSEILLNTSLGLTMPSWGEVYTIPGGEGGRRVTLVFGLFPQITWSPGTLTSARESQGPDQFPYFFPAAFSRLPQAMERKLWPARWWASLPG